MKNIYSIIISLFFLLLLTGCQTTNDQASGDLKFTLIDFGIVAVGDSTTRVVDDENLSGVNSVKNFAVIESTDQIPAMIGTHFGYTYEISGGVDGQIIELQYIGIHPELTDADTGKTYSGYKYTKRVTVGKEGLQGYGFEFDWELVPGTWTFQIEYLGKIVLEKTFTVSVD